MRKIFEPKKRGLHLSRWELRIFSSSNYAYFCVVCATPAFVWQLFSEKFFSFSTL